MRAGIAVSPATATRIPSTAAASHQAAAGSSPPSPPFATTNSPMPSGTPRMAPGNAGNSWAADTPR